MERALLIYLASKQESEEQVDSVLNELEQLVGTAGARVVARMVQRRERPDPAYYIGTGKVAELAQLVEEDDINLVVFESEISPLQMRNIEEKLDVKVLDRTGIILDIFAGRAISREGKLQVELAQMQYILPRLTGYGVKLSRLGGGVGTRGPGETKLETDRRRIRKRIGDLKKEIEEIKKHRELHRSRRKKDGNYVVSLVGYTNAGKSTLMNALTDAKAFTEDKLFATLDPLVRNIPLNEGSYVLLTDTVGFIRNLPLPVITAFQATLEEIKEADLLLHVVDISHPEFREQIQVVRDMLREMKIDARKEVMVFNKFDRLNLTDINVDALKREYPNACFISAFRQQSLEDLKNIIMKYYEKSNHPVDFYIPYQDSHFLSRLYREGRVIETADHDGVYMWVKAEVSAEFLKENYSYTYLDERKDE